MGLKLLNKTHIPSIDRLMPEPKPKPVPFGFLERPIEGKIYRNYYYDFISNQSAFIIVLHRELW